MNAKKIEAVPTPSQVLRQAIADRDAIEAERTAIAERRQAFAPLEAEVTTAEAELQAVLDRDAKAMSAWAANGAQGDAPEPDHKAREAATAKLAGANAKLTASGAARDRIQADLDAINHRQLAAIGAVRSAQTAVAEQEWRRTAQAMKDAAVAYLTAEQHYFGARALMFDTDKDRASQVSGSIDKIIQPLNRQEESELRERLRPEREARHAALLRGEGDT